jgi:hypothetical protein
MRDGSVYAGSFAGGRRDGAGRLQGRAVRSIAMGVGLARGPAPDDTRATEGGKKGGAAKAGTKSSSSDRLPSPREPRGGMNATAGGDPGDDDGAVAVAADDDCVFEGTFKDDLPHGTGVLRDARGIEWTGRFARGAPAAGAQEWTVSWTDPVRGTLLRNVYVGGYDPARGFQGRGTHTLTRESDGATEVYDGEHNLGARAGRGELRRSGPSLDGGPVDPRIVTYTGLFWDSVPDSTTSHSGGGGGGADAHGTGGSGSGSSSGGGSSGGRATFTDGSQYEGAWARGAMHGTGTLRAAPSNQAWVQYTGAFAEGQRHGRGAVTLANGDVLTCDFAAGRRARETRDAEIAYASGHVYRGSIVDSVRHGRGKLTCPNDEFYDGEWSENMMQGHGTFAYISGAQYTGEWVGHVRAGAGRLTWLNGDVYDGAFADDEPHGAGVATLAATGDRVFATFAHGAPVACRAGGRILFGNGDRYEGGLAVTALPATSSALPYRIEPDTAAGLSEDDEDGGGDDEDGGGDEDNDDDDEGNGGSSQSARLVSDSGDIYVGGFRRGQRHGRGRIVSAVGWVLEGAFRDGVPHGRCALTTVAGDKFALTWEHGAPRLPDTSGAASIERADGSKFRGAVGAPPSGDAAASTAKPPKSSQKQHPADQAATRVRFGSADFGTVDVAVPHGRGVLTDVDGSIVSAAWAHGKLHGRGKVTRRDGRVEECVWEDGSRR